MRYTFMRAAAAAALLAVPVASAAQEHAHHAPADTSQAMSHGMFMRDIGGGWRVLGMAQVFPIITTGFGSGANDGVTLTEFNATQPAVMFNLESAGSRIVLRTTLNFEGLTQGDGELTWGGWGEGYIDRRHPHTIVHEAMLSANFTGVLGGAASLSAGKGFAAYGTDDPMSRPAVKYPTNHHLSQILERYTLNGAWLRGGTSVEAGIFAGNEPTGPYDFGNHEGFPNSWSARLTQRFSGGTEVSASFGNVVEEHGDESRTTRLVNGYVRHQATYGAGAVYGLVEASRADNPDHDGEDYFAILAEGGVTRGVHAPYARVEVSTRPEFEREGPVGDDGFFRYDHDAHAIGATRWMIATLGYGYEATSLPFSVRPFVEVQHYNAANHRGDVSVRELFGTTRFFSATAGFRLFLGGGPMRMGAYGVLDDMTRHGGALQQ